MIKPRRFTLHEGGDWIAWEDRKKFNRAPSGIVAHSIEFENGCIFDMFNGWRDQQREKDNRMRSWNDKVKPGRGIDDNKGVGFQVQGNDVAANKRIYGGSLPNTSAVTGNEAK